MQKILAVDFPMRVYTHARTFDATAAALFDGGFTALLGFAGACSVSKFK